MDTVSALWFYTMEKRGKEREGGGKEERMEKKGRRNGRKDEGGKKGGRKRERRRKKRGKEREETKTMKSRRGQ